MLFALCEDPKKEKGLSVLTECKARVHDGAERGDGGAVFVDSLQHHAFFHDVLHLQHQWQLEIS